MPIHREGERLTIEILGLITSFVETQANQNELLS
jgi:hypothetical protein